MHQARIERRLFDLSARLARARAQLELMDTQLEVFEQMAGDAEVRSLVAEDRSQVDLEAIRHFEAMSGGRALLVGDIARMERAQEALITRLTSGL